MLKLKIDKAAHAALPAHFQSEYKADGDNFVLDTDVPFEDTTTLKNALKAEKEHRKTATEKVTALETSIAGLTEERDTLAARAQKPSDLEKSWSEKLAKREKELTAEIDKRTARLRTLLVDNVAQQMAAEISVSPELMLPHILKRLTIEEQDGNMITRVLDAEGKASALSANELKAELLANKTYAPIIKASEASGGGAQGSKKPPGVGDVADFKKMSEAQKVELYRKNPTEFQRLAEAATK